ncbi:MAG: cell division protein FtsQ/DivIB [Limnochordia bacterium]|jgi:cell division protein FtsQ
MGDVNGDSRGFVLALVGILVIVAGVAFLYSPFFCIQDVIIEGSSQLTREEILSTIGLIRLQNIFRFDVANAQARLNSLPQVHEVEISRKLPNRLIITLRERRPVAVLPYAEGFLLVDADGRVLGPAHEPNLPVLNGVPPVTIQVGEILSSRPAQLGARLAGLFEPELHERLSEINVADLKDIRVLGKGLQVRFGLGTDLELKMDVLTSILSRIPSGARATIDLRIPKSPILEQH